MLLLPQIVAQRLARFFEIKHLRVRSFGNRVESGEK